MTADNPGIRIPPPLIVLGLLAVGFALDGRLTAPTFNASAAVAAGVGLMVVGLAAGGMALALFRRAGTKPEPWKSSSALVTGGVYRLTRNPMYLGMLLVAAGATLIGGGLWSAMSLVGAFLVLNFYVVAREEGYLERQFGASYHSYRSRVRRWM